MVESNGNIAGREIIGRAKTSVALLLLWFSLLAPYSATAQTIRERFDEIAELSKQKSGLDQIREINLDINTLLNTTHFWPKSAETDHWRTVDQILDSPFRDNCKDFVALKEDLLGRVGVKSERVVVLLRSNLDAHAVLKLNFEGRELVLDNLRRVMVSMDDLKDVYETDNAASHVSSHQLAAR
jgi:predicted transglutaminase-like cysteine proteinase